jgi:RimJ/RimL family protein N-acetyltransferase
VSLLENDFVRLEPLADRHREPLREAAGADQEIWTIYPYSMAGEHFDPFWERIQAERAAGRCIPFAVMSDDVCVGISCYLGIDLVNGSVEIGGTYYRPDQRGTAVNPAAKHLLLGHAFASGVRRVRFNVDAINARSRAAMLKLGAVQEGILRQDRMCWTGRVRDTVVFSVLADEWPAIGDRLLRRLENWPQRLPPRDR